VWSKFPFLSLAVVLQERNKGISSLVFTFMQCIYTELVVSYADVICSLLIFQQADGPTMSVETNGSNCTVAGKP
jgi:hypothetical protein